MILNNCTPCNCVLCCFPLSSSSCSPHLLLLVVVVLVCQTCYTKSSPGAPERNQEATFSAFFTLCRGLSLIEHLGCACVWQDRRESFCYFAYKIRRNLIKRIPAHSVRRSVRAILTLCCAKRRATDWHISGFSLEDGEPSFLPSRHVWCHLETHLRSHSVDPASMAVSSPVRCHFSACLELLSSSWTPRYISSLHLCI